MSSNFQKTIAEISYITEKNHPRLYNNLHLAFFTNLVNKDREIHIYIDFGYPV